MGVFFSSVASVMSAFTILSIPWSVLRSSFSEDSTSAHCSNSRFSRLFVSSLSPFLLDLFLSHNVFPPQKPQIPDASVEESTTVLKRVFVVSANFMLKSFFTDFIQTQNAPLEIRRRSQTNFTRDIYHNNQIIYFFW